MAQKTPSIIKLDVGCGAEKREGYIGMDARALSGVDIVHNFEKFPWPVADESVSLLNASHVLEHVSPAYTDPRLSGLIRLLKAKGAITDMEIERYIGEPEVFGTFIRFMDEAWRVLSPGGQFTFVVPYAGSPGYWQDPTHINPISETTLAYFDPSHPSGLWRIYEPRPWKVMSLSFDRTGNLEVVLEKRPQGAPYDVSPAFAPKGRSIVRSVLWRLRRANAAMTRYIDRQTL